MKRNRQILFCGSAESERIIEDFMIAANECVAMHEWMEIPSMYRNTPELRVKMRDFATTVSLGYNFQGGIQKCLPRKTAAESAE